MRVFVYYNLHKHCWSVKALEGKDKGRVVAHLNSLVLNECTFRVQKAGQEKVRKTGQKNVHAGVVGTWTQKRTFPKYKSWRQVTYNPHKYDTFVDVESKTPVHSSHCVVLNNRRVWRK